VWEIRVFGRHTSGKPTQISKTVRGTKREAQRVAAALELRPPSNAGGRTVAEVLAAWREVNDPVWAETSRRDYESRVAKILEDPIASMNVARVGVADIELWHARMRKQKVGESAIRCRHAVLRAAFAQRAPREAMTGDDVRAVLAAATSFEPAAGAALRLAAIAGLRRAEIAALQWTDLRGNQLKIDSSACAIQRGDDSYVDDVPTKTANARTVTLDDETVQGIVHLRSVRQVVSPYLFSDTTDPANPDRIGWWWSRARELSGIDKKWRLHDLRHWTATTAITSGHDVRTVAGRLGHANPAMTLRVYAHAVEGADQALAETLAAALDEPEVA
jgi:integrase